MILRSQSWPAKFFWFKWPSIAFSHCWSWIRLLVCRVCSSLGMEPSGSCRKRWWRLTSETVNGRRQVIWLGQRLAHKPARWSRSLVCLPVSGHSLSTVVFRMFRLTAKLDNCCLVQHSQQWGCMLYKLLKPSPGEYDAIWRNKSQRDHRDNSSCFDFSVSFGKRRLNPVLNALTNLISLEEDMVAFIW